VLPLFRADEPRFFIRFDVSRHLSLDCYLISSYVQMSSPFQVPSSSNQTTTAVISFASQRNYSSQSLVNSPEDLLNCLGYSLGN